MQRVSKRLDAILDTIPSCNVMADIGCDHGKLITAAVEKGICKQGIGADISRESLKKATEYVQNKNLTEKIQLIVSDGFGSIDTKVDVAVIAGMGANEIIKIISDKNAADSYVLCPHQDAEILRRYINHPFVVMKDFIVRDRQKFYPIILVQKNGKNDNNNYSDDELFLGKNIPETEDYNERNRKRVHYLSKLIGENRTINLSNTIIQEYEALLRWQKSMK